MPTLTYPIPEHNVLFARCYGHIDPTDVIGWNVANHVQARGDHGFVIVVDLSEMTGTDMTFKDINAIFGQLLRHYQPRSERLFVLLYAPDDLPYGLTRIMQSLSSATEHVAVQVFRNPGKLRDHLPDLPLSFDELRSLALKNTRSQPLDHLQPD